MKGSERQLHLNDLKTTTETMCISHEPLNGPADTELADGISQVVEVSSQTSITAINVFEKFSTCVVSVAARSREQP